MQKFVRKWLRKLRSLGEESRFGIASGRRKRVCTALYFDKVFLSPKDAIYCVEFLRLIHKLSPPGLRLLSVVDRLFKELDLCNDYMQMKNVLLVLNRMVRIYPATKEDAEELLVTLKPMSESDEREDLKTLARMYCTGLEMSIRDRQMVATRQEYAGLPPPPKKKTDGGAPQENQSTKSAKQAQEEKKDTKDSKRKRPESTHATGGRGDNNTENPKARSKYRDDRNGNGQMQKQEAPKSTVDNVKPEKGGSTKPLALPNQGGRGLRNLEPFQKGQNKTETLRTREHEENK
eukprot:jgi/Picre1/28104/NNA_003511.t1